MSWTRGIVWDRSSSRDTWRARGAGEPSCSRGLGNSVFAVRCTPSDQGLDHIASPVKWSSRFLRLLNGFCEPLEDGRAVTPCQRSG